MIQAGVVAGLLCIGHISALVTTCGMGVECSGCPDDKVQSFLFRSGEATNVCCPGCISKYVSFGYTRIRERPYCNCDFVRVEGSASKGEECSSPGMTTYTSLNGMPICCADPMVVVQGPTYISGDYVFNCEERGDCLRGSECTYCNQSEASYISDVRVCCPDCDSMPDVRGNNYCYCLGNTESDDPG